MFFVEMRDMFDKWKRVKYAAPCSTVEAAWDKVRTYDIDGLVLPEYRVVGEDKKPVARPQ